MLAIDIARKARRLPLVILIGLALMAVGGALDVVIHLGSTSGHHAHEGLGGEHLAHLVGIAGMVLVLAGVVAFGVRSQRRPPAATHGGVDHDAHR